MPGSRVVDILLLDLPVALWADASAHTERFLAAMRTVAEKNKRGPVARLLCVVERLEGEFAEAAAPSELELRAAAARRLKEVDVAYGAVRCARDDLATLADAYDAADKWCRTHDMPELAATKEVAAFRRWFLGQIVGQLDGDLPTPWPGA
ncbi:MAG TPA: hypothetical protein VNQ77_19495 [Frankiaceae bacterium]|nr:hypothetical protein [Frankiaceae bacterium]